MRVEPYLYFQGRCEEPWTSTGCNQGRQLGGRPLWRYPGIAGAARSRSQGGTCSASRRRYHRAGLRRPGWRPDHIQRLLAFADRVGRSRGGAAVCGAVRRRQRPGAHDANTFRVAPTSLPIASACPGRWYLQPQIRNGLKVIVDVRFIAGAGHCQAASLGWMSHDRPGDVPQHGGAVIIKWPCRPRRNGRCVGVPGAGMARALGLILLVCTVLYIAPRTTVLGAILLSAYLGGAVATQLRVGAPLFHTSCSGSIRRPAVGWALASRHAGPGAHAVAWHRNCLRTLIFQLRAIRNRPAELHREVVQFEVLTVIDVVRLIRVAGGQEDDLVGASSNYK